MPGHHSAASLKQIKLCAKGLLIQARSKASHPLRKEIDNKLKAIDACKTTGELYSILCLDQTDAPFFISLNKATLSWGAFFCSSLCCQQSYSTTIERLFSLFPDTNPKATGATPLLAQQASVLPDWYGDVALRACMTEEAERVAYQYRLVYLISENLIQARSRLQSENQQRHKITSLNERLTAYTLGEVRSALPQASPSFRDQLEEMVVLSSKGGESNLPTSAGLGVMRMLTIYDVRYCIEFLADRSKLKLYKQQHASDLQELSTPNASIDEIASVISNYYAKKTVSGQFCSYKKLRELKVLDTDNQVTDPATGKQHRAGDPEFNYLLKARLDEQALSFSETFAISVGEETCVEALFGSQRCPLAMPFNLSPRKAYHKAGHGSHWVTLFIFPETDGSFHLVYIDPTANKASKTISIQLERVRQQLEQTIFSLTQSAELKKNGETGVYIASTTTDKLSSEVSLTTLFPKNQGRDPSCGYWSALYAFIFAQHGLEQGLKVIQNLTTKQVRLPYFLHEVLTPYRRVWKCLEAPLSLPSEQEAKARREAQKMTDTLLLSLKTQAATDITLPFLASWPDYTIAASDGNDIKARHSAERQGVAAKTHQPVYHFDPEQGDAAGLGAGGMRNS